MSTSRHFLVGLFFLVALCVLGYYTLFLTNVSWFKERYQIQVHFKELNGLKEGDAVQVAGMRWGRIKTTEFDQTQPVEKRIMVIVELEKPLELRDGFVIQIEDATLLGGRLLTIDPGPPDGAVVPSGRALQGRVAPNPLDALGELVSESQRGVKEIVENLAEVARRAREGKGTFSRLLNDEKVADDLAATLESAAKSLASLEKVTQDLASGKGSAGLLLTDTTAYDSLVRASNKLNELFDKALSLADGVQKGQGTLGVLLKDEELAANIRTTVGDIGAITAGLREGRGSIGKLLTDDTLVVEATSIVKKINEGSGTIGLLLNRSEVYDDIRETTANLAETTAAIREGRGSIGRLINDDELYQQIRAALAVVQRTLEEYREAAPITTFTSVFFSAF